MSEIPSVQRRLDFEHDDCVAKAKELRASETFTIRPCHKCCGQGTKPFEGLVYCSTCSKWTMEGLFLPEING